MMRVTLAGPELTGLVVDRPGASVRLLLPSPGTAELVIPRWHGNEFLLPDHTRAVLRTFTPRRVDAHQLELDLDIVLHGHGVASEWAATTRPGDAAAISGPGRGYDIDSAAARFVLAGDESAIPAITQVIDALPLRATAAVLLEVAHPDARITFADHPGLTITWHDLPVASPPGDALVRAFRAVAIDDETRIWVAGEAAAVQRIRRYCFDELGISRRHCTIRGYWKHGRGGDINP